MKRVYNKKRLFGAFDLHSNNNHLAIIDGEDNRVYRKKLPNQPDVILAELEPFRDCLAGIVGRSRYAADKSQKIATAVCNLILS